MEQGVSRNHAEPIPVRVFAVRTHDVLVRIRNDRHSTQGGLQARVRYERDIARDIARDIGELVRQWRIERGLGLREFARRVGLSPTFVSKFERGEFKPPGEEKLLEMARVLEKDRDEILALANKTPSDLPPIIREHPRAMGRFLRTATGLSVEQIDTLTAQARKLKEE